MNQTVEINSLVFKYQIPNIDVTGSINDIGKENTLDILKSIANFRSEASPVTVFRNKVRHKKSELNGNPVLKEMDKMRVEIQEDKSMEEIIASTIVMIENEYSTSGNAELRDKQYRCLLNVYNQAEIFVPVNILERIKNYRNDHKDDLKMTDVLLINVKDKVEIPF
jgi:hypothetical protein